jgi:hypothetical protein
LPIEGVVQPEALIILQQPQLSSFLITIPNLTPSIPNLTPQQQNNGWQQNVITQQGGRTNSHDS